MVMRESGGHRTFLFVDKWDDDQASWVTRKSGIVEPQAADFDRLKVKPYASIVHEDCNLITDAGWNLLMKNSGGTPGTLFSASVGRIAIGSGTTPVSYTDTDITGPNKFYKLFATAPTVGSTHTAGLVFSATFGATQANYAWQEFGTDQGVSDGTTVTAVFFNHGIANNGTKVNGNVWSATETITWT